MKPTLTQLKRLVGNPNAYAVQNPDGTYAPVRKPLDDEVLAEHLRGVLTVGTYVNSGDKARFVCWDVDEDSMEKVQALRAAAIELGAFERALGVEYSGKKGYHLWLLLQDYLPAEELRRFGKAVCALAGVECEVNPKQSDVRDLGNLVKLPGSVHRVTGKANDFLDVVPLPMAVGAWAEKVVPNLPAQVAAQRSSRGNADNRFPCLESIQQEGVSEGGRNIQLFHLATMFRRHGATDETIELILQNVNEKCDPPVDEFELASIVESSRHSGPICDQLPQERQCGYLCIKARLSGLNTRPGQLRNAGVGECVVVRLDSRAGATVTFGHPDLQTAKGALRHGT